MMKDTSIPTRSSRNIFLRAAELQCAMKEYQRHDCRMIWKGRPEGNISVYACDNINEASLLTRGAHYYDIPEIKYFRKRFKPADHNGTTSWWPFLENHMWDHESRILALLLCAEMLRR